MAAVLVQTVTKNTAPSGSLTVGSTVAGNTLMLTVACAGGPTQGATAVTDNLGQTWVKVDGGNGSANSVGGSFWYFPNSAAGVTTLTITYGNTTSSFGLVFREYSGLTTTPLDVHVVAPFVLTGSTPSSGATASTTQANILVIGWAYTSATAGSAGSGYGNFVASNTTGVTASMEDLQTGTIGAQTATFNYTSVSYICGCACFKMVSGPLGSNKFLSLMGAGT